MKYDMLLAMDGNNSLKRLARILPEHSEGNLTLSSKTIERPDDWTINDCMFLRPHEVNIYTDEVLRQPAPDQGSLESTTPEGLVSDQAVAGGPIPCTERWKNLSDESDKKMWGIFKETGIFVTVCRHGIVFL